MSDSSVATAKPIKNTTPKPCQDNEEIVPVYLKDTYTWSYLDPKNANLLDREPIVKAILFWQHNTLRQAAFSEIEAGSQTLQVAAVYGNFSQHLSQHIGSNGRLKLIDIAPIQVRNTQTKLLNFPQSEVVVADAASLQDEPYDVVLSYFLLHEIPDEYKKRVLDNMLAHIKPGGKLVIVDYHKPHWVHPLKPLVSLIFATLEPFARALWNHPVSHFASEPEKYHWQQETYFGGLYQRVVVQHRNTDLS